MQSRLTHAEVVKDWTDWRLIEELKTVQSDPHFRVTNSWHRKRYYAIRAEQINRKIK